ncbi:hypothetical protein D3C77_456690 [compost metagenome]
MLLCLYALGYHDQAHFLSQGDSQFQHWARFAVVNSRHEGAVDFQQVDGQMLHVLQAGITGAEVIQGYRVAALAADCQVLTRRFKVQQAALGNF